MTLAPRAMRKGSAGTSPADTEGSELMILTPFDFDRFRPRLITVEHGHEPRRRKALFDLLTRHGYRRWREALSQSDDGYARDRSPGRGANLIYPNGAAPSGH